MIKRLKHTVLIICILAAVIASGCGGGADVKSTTRTTTLGQELMDLEKAYKQGIISEKEYKAAKEKLMKGQ